MVGDSHAEVAGAAIVDRHGLHAVIEDLGREAVLEALCMAVERCEPGSSI